MRNKIIIVILILIVGVFGVRYAINSLFGADKQIVIADSFERLQVSGANALVEIRPSEEDTTTIEIISKKKQRKGLVKAKVDDGTLTVKLKDKRTWVIPFGYSPPTLVIEVPKKQYDSLKVKSDNGKISVESLQIKELDLETDNGKIAVKDVEANTVRVETDNGLIELDHVEGAITAKTDTGLISLVTPDLDRPIDLKTDVGKISVQTKTKPTNTTILAETDIGSINIFGSKNNKTVFGNGENLVKLQSDVGAIVVQ
ncbi:DUF4097 family beta strand repeat-containing protein [Sporosarcina sp. 179-K 3D1 HS]|uniref:DUF4097 family beta strand repeat-containing protein n=1 Tax=Sporosarcina sp. 179-K 3D1 HS TaxID=3232169 RepID=UPI0039A06264